MSKVTHFQRYATKENWMTNTTLHLLSRVQDVDLRMYNNVLNSLLEGELDAGPVYRQQVKGRTSVPDGMIQQSSFQIVLETKLDGNLTLSQLKRHLEMFDPKIQSKILVALTIEENPSVATQLRKHISESGHGDVSYVNLTYEELIRTLNAHVRDGDYFLQDLIDDYEELCVEQGLTSLHQRTMLALTARETISQNLQYALYYDRASTVHTKKFSYLALYDNKGIRAVGKVDKIVVCDYNGSDLLSPNSESLDLTSEQETSIIQAMKTTPYASIMRGHRFMLVEKFIVTSFLKQSSGPMRFKKYFRLDEYIEGLSNDASAEFVANALDGKTWD